MVGEESDDSPATSMQNPVHEFASEDLKGHASHLHQRSLEEGDTNEGEDGSEEREVQADSTPQPSSLSYQAYHVNSYRSTLKVPQRKEKLPPPPPQEACMADMISFD